MMGGTMQLRIRLLAAAAVCITLLAGCGTAAPLRPVNNADFTDSTRYKNGGLADPDTALFSFGRGKPKDDSDSGGGALGVNAFLWRGALETLSFMPLASADPFGGVIITDWYQPPASSGERFKATAYILGRQLRVDGVRVSIYRQVQQGGTWVDAPVTSNTASEIENKVLARARELRAQSLGSSS
jgi:hypothetical protein